MKKLLFYINALHHGGAERVIAYLANSLSKNEYNCVMVTSIKEPWEYPLDVNVKRTTLFDSGMPHNFIRRNILATLRLRKIIESEKPDMVISFMAEPNFRAIIANIGIKSKNLISIRNDPNREYPNLLFRFTAKILYPLADGIVFQTQEAMNYFSQAVQKKSRIILNPVDEVFFNTPLKKERKGIVTTGRLVKQKNHALLIKAYSSIADKVEDDLYIYGEGELQKELEKLINDLGVKNRVHLLGAVRNVPEVLSNAKLFVLSSDYEGMPNSLMEAMAMGLPCISTDCPCGGPRELLSENDLFKCNDVEQLSFMIFNKTNILNNMNNQNITKFRSKNIIKRWKDFIEELIRGGTRYA